MKKLINNIKDKIEDAKFGKRFYHICYLVDYVREIGDKDMFGNVLEEELKETVKLSDFFWMDKKDIKQFLERKYKDGIEITEYYDYTQINQYKVVDIAIISAYKCKRKIVNKREWKIINNE